MGSRVSTSRAGPVNPGEPVGAAQGDTTSVEKAGRSAHGDPHATAMVSLPQLKQSLGRHPTSDEVLTWRSTIVRQLFALYPGSDLYRAIEYHVHAKAESRMELARRVVPEVPKSAVALDCHVLQKTGVLDESRFDSLRRMLAMPVDDGSSTAEFLSALNRGLSMVDAVKAVLTSLADQSEVASRLRGSNSNEKLQVLDMFPGAAEIEVKAALAELNNEVGQDADVQAFLNGHRGLETCFQEVKALLAGSRFTERQIAYVVRAAFEGLRKSHRSGEENVEAQASVAQVERALRFRALPVASWASIFATLSVLKPQDNRVVELRQAVKENLSFVAAAHGLPIQPSQDSPSSVLVDYWFCGALPGSDKDTNARINQTSLLTVFRPDGAELSDSAGRLGPAARSARVMMEEVTEELCSVLPQIEQFVAQAISRLRVAHSRGEILAIARELLGNDDTVRAELGLNQKGVFSEFSSDSMPLSPSDFVRLLKSCALPLNPVQFVMYVESWAQSFVREKYPPLARSMATFAVVRKLQECVLSENPQQAAGAVELQTREAKASEFSELLTAAKVSGILDESQLQKVAQALGLEENDAFMRLLKAQAAEAGQPDGASRVSFIPKGFIVSVGVIDPLCQLFLRYRTNDATELAACWEADLKAVRGYQTMWGATYNDLVSLRDIDAQRDPRIAFIEALVEGRRVLSQTIPGKFPGLTDAIQELLTAVADRLEVEHNKMSLNEVDTGDYKYIMCSFGGDQLDYVVGTALLFDNPKAALKLIKNQIEASTLLNPELCHLDAVKKSRLPEHLRDLAAPTFGHLFFAIQTGFGLGAPRRPIPSLLNGYFSSPDPLPTQPQVTGKKRGRPPKS